MKTLLDLLITAGASLHPPLGVADEPLAVGPDQLRPPHVKSLLASDDASGTIRRTAGRPAP